MDLREVKKMKIYELTCLNSDGIIERNGRYLHREAAENEKTRLDNLPYNIKYGIKQGVRCEIVNEDKS
jgi:hypothetical protein